MSRNIQTSSNVLRTIIRRSGQSKYCLSRRAHTLTPSPPFGPHGPSIPSSQALPSEAFRTPGQRASQDIHVRKKRRFTTKACAAASDNYKPWGAHEDTRGRDTWQHDESPSLERYGRGGDRDGRQEDGGIIVMSHRTNFRDKQGRPWARSSDDNTSQGAAAAVLGVGVGVSAPPARKKKPRIELRDLTVKPKKKKLEPWQSQKAALEQKFGEEGWNPRKKLSPDAMDGIRALHEEDSERWPTSILAEHFRVSPEAIRRILKSKWQPKDEEGVHKRRERWARRHDRIWDHQAELGLRPQREKDREVEDPDTFEEELRAKEILDNARKA